MHASPGIKADRAGIPFRPVPFPQADMAVTPAADGSLRLASTLALPDLRGTLPSLFAARAAQFPDRICWAAADGAGGWRTLSFADAHAQVEAVAQGLIDQGISPGDPVMILSGNSLAHAILCHAAMICGAPVVPVSPGYSRMSRDFGKLRHVSGLVTPRLIFVEAVEPYRAALEALQPLGATIIAASGAEVWPERGIIPLSDLLSTVPSAAVAARRQALDPDGVAKVMFTSGSTGKPKGVMQTQRMLVASAAMARAALFGDTSLDAFEKAIADRAEICIDWLPWSHVSGAANLHNCVTYGSSLYIDDGKPLPGEIDRTLRNLRGLSPSFYMNVPFGYQALVTAMESDPALAQTFFSALGYLTAGGAATPPPLYDRIQDLAVRTTGQRVRLIAGYGATEATCGVAATTRQSERSSAGQLGTPFPGVTMKLVPAGGHFELRLKGTSITPGYYRNDEATAAAFDAEGFYRTGDLVDWADSADPQQGLRFCGRLAEEFKLDTGTWVNGTAVRQDVMTAVTPLLADLVVCGLNQPHIGVLAWADPAAWARAGGEQAFLSALRGKIVAYNRDNAASSRRVARLMLLTDPPSADRHELTDKGTINQSAVQRNREDSVAQLFRDPPDAAVLTF